MTDQVMERLKTVAQGLVSEINTRPPVRTTFGPWFKKRLMDEDWIKSLELINFTRPLDADPAPLWKPQPQEVAHIERRVASLPPGATTLDALSETLTAFGRHTVGGIRHWFKEMGGEKGYWLDKRIHSLAWEMVTIASMFEWSKVSKLRKLSSNSVPDYLIEIGPLVLVLEAKTIFGCSWPLTVLQTMLKALFSLGGVPEAEGIMIVATDPKVRTSEIENQVAILDTKRLIQAIRTVTNTGVPEKITSGLIATPRTDVARSLKIRASYLRIETSADFDLEFARWTPPLSSVKDAALEAWEQCEGFEDIPWAALRLNVAAITAEAWPGHPELAAIAGLPPNQLLIRQWLEDDVWPNHPNRALLAQFGDIFKPVWFVSPTAIRNIDQVPSAPSH